MSKQQTSTLLYFDKHIIIDKPDRNAIDWLSNTTDLSKQVIKNTMTKGAVWLTSGKHTQRLRRASRQLKIGDTLHLYYNAEILATKPAEAILISDEGDYSVWFKPCGMLSQGSKWSDHCTITRWAVQHLQPERPAFIVHRLDRAATGLILIAHTKKTTTALSQLFQQRAIKKTYRAIVQGHFPSSPKILTINNPIDDKQAISHVTLLDYSETRDCSLVSVDIETGRKHQIRKHLSEAGFPILGDRLYSQQTVFSTDLQLTAISLAFTCPITNQSRKYLLEDHLQPQL